MSERTDHIKAVFERNGKAMAMRPSVGLGTASTKVTLREGLTCDVEDSAWKLTVDMSQKSGGDGHAPDPGVYSRTALGSCLAIGYTLWAATRGITFSKLEIEVQADDETRDSAHREYLDSIAPYRRGDGYAVPGEFVIARGEA